MRRDWQAAITGDMAVSEHTEQAAVIEWKLLVMGNRPELKWLHSVPNGAKLPWTRNKQGRRFSPQAQWLINEGLTPGVADLDLPVARGGYFGLKIEMKDKGGKLTKEQAQFLLDMKKAGYLAIMCEGAEEAIRMITWYLDLPLTVVK